MPSIAKQSDERKQQSRALEHRMHIPIDARSLAMVKQEADRYGIKQSQMVRVILADYFNRAKRSNSKGT